MTTPGDPSAVSRMIAECLNCLGIVASPEAFKQLDSPPRREEFREVLERLIAAYYSTADSIRAQPAASVRALAFVQAEPLLKEFHETLSSRGFDDEQLLRAQVIAFLNQFGAAMNISNLGDLIATTPLPPAK